MPQPNPPLTGKENQTAPSKDSAAQHVESGQDAAADRFPPVRQDDSIDRSSQEPAAVSSEARSFESDVESPKSGETSRDVLPDPSVNQGFLGPRGDPAEGKR